MKLKSPKRRIIKQFNSKRNQVFLVEDRSHDKPRLVVEKHMVSTGKEKNILEQLLRHGVAVPKVLDSSANRLVLQYIPGPTLCDHLEELEDSGVPTSYALPLVKAWCSWLQSCYSALSQGWNVILGDVNLRNFLLFDNVVYGLDFECCSVGRVEEDLGKIIAFMLTYNPAFTAWKVELIQKSFPIFLVNLELDQFGCVQVIREELDAISKRRNISISASVIDQVLAPLIK